MASSDSNGSATAGPSQLTNRTPSPPAANNQEVRANHVTCSICQENYHRFDSYHTPVMTHCGHVFGKSCFEIRLDLNPDPTCPVCHQNQYYRCGHLCQPRPLERPWSVMPRVEDGSLAYHCPMCAESDAMLFFGDIDPDLRTAMEIRAQILENLGYGALAQYLSPMTVDFVAQIYIGATPEDLAWLHGIEEMPEWACEVWLNDMVGPWEGEV